MRSNGVRRTLLAAALLTWVLPVGATTIVVGGAGPRVEGSGNLAEDVRAVSGFSKLELRGPVNVQLRHADVERVTLRGDDNILPLIETRVEGGRLIVGARKDAAFRTRNRLTAVVEFTQLDGVLIRGSGDVRADRVQAAIFDGTIQGAGDVSITELTADTVALSVSGSGNFKARGRAGTLGIVIEGSGDVSVEDLQAKTVAVRIAGSGDARVHATDRLQVRIAGSGDVRYRGAPQIEKKVSGSGDVRPLR